MQKKLDIHKLTMFMLLPMAILFAIGSFLRFEMHEEYIENSSHDICMFHSIQDLQGNGHCCEHNKKVVANIFTKKEKIKSYPVLKVNPDPVFAVLNTETKAVHPNMVIVDDGYIENLIPAPVADIFHPPC
jgi:hypothetical protein